jgi:hypothetical protein
MAVDLATVTHEAFAGLLNQGFKVLAGDSSLGMRLVRVTPANSAQPGARRPFALVLRGPTEPVLPQQICRVEHPSLGSMEIFLVPIGPDASGMQYEAVFG